MDARTVDHLKTSTGVDVAPLLVTLYPDREEQRYLCQTIVEQTRWYLWRPPLTKPPFTVTELANMSLSRGRNRDRMISFRDKRWRELDKQVEILRDRFANNRHPVKIAAAWQDWNMRQCAFWDFYKETHPAYLDVVGELIKDLKKPPLEEVPPEKAELHYVAILVS